MNLRHQLNTEVTGADVVVLGVRIGDPAGAVPLDSITSTTRNSLDRRTVRGDGREFELRDDGSEVEISLSTRIEEVIEGGGILRADGVALRIRDGRILEITVLKPGPDLLSIRTQRALERALGRPERTRMSRMGRVLDYPHRELTVIWDTRADRVSWLRFGADPSPARTAGRRGELVLQNGRQIEVIYLKQWSTYAGLIMGTPHRKMNEEMIAGAIRELGKNAPHYLVSPRRTPIVLRGGRRHRKYEALPGTTCVARFASIDPARDQGADGSELWIIWFQPQFAFPIEPSVQREIEAVDWESLAEDYEY